MTGTLKMIAAGVSALALTVAAADAQPPDGRGQGRGKAKDEAAQQADKAKDKAEDAAENDGRGEAEDKARGKGKDKNKDAKGDEAGDDAELDDGRGPDKEKNRGKPADDVEENTAAVKDKVNCGLGERAEGETGARDPWADRDADCAAVQNAQGDENASAGGKPEDAGPNNDRGDKAGADDDDNDEVEAEEADEAEEAKPEKKRRWRWPWQRRDDD